MKVELESDGSQPTALASLTHSVSFKPELIAMFRQRSVSLQTGKG